MIQRAQNSVLFQQRRVVVRDETGIGCILSIPSQLVPHKAECNTREIIGTT